MIFFNIQNPMVFTFGILGNIVAFLVFLAPAPTFYKICKKKSTEGFQSLPYVVALLSSMLWIYYATLKPNEILLITINSIGVFIEAIYISIYIYFAPKKVKMFAVELVVVLDVIGFGFVVILTHFLVQGAERVQILGWINVALAAFVYIAPLSIMKQVICTKSVEFMPVSLSFALSLNAVMWFFYGLLLKDFYIAVPNIVGFIFGVAQIALYLVYKNCKIDIAEDKLPTAMKLEPKANSEIYPVCSLPIQGDQILEVITAAEEDKGDIPNKEQWNTPNDRV